MATFKHLNGIEVDIGSPTAFEVKMLPGAGFFSVVANYANGKSLAVYQATYWHEALLFRRQFAQHVVDGGNNVKVHPVTKSIVEDS